MKKLFCIILLFTCFNSFSQELVFQQVFIKAHDIEAYDAFLKNHFSKIHQKEWMKEVYLHGMLGK